MSKIFKWTTTKKEGWQTECQHWVNAGQPFEIHDIETSHLGFCHELCASGKCKYQYQFRGSESVAIFSPV
jgi:hypothetical protein